MSRAQIKRQLTVYVIRRTVENIEVIDAQTSHADFQIKGESCRFFYKVIKGFCIFNLNYLKNIEKWTQN